MYEKTKKKISNLLYLVFFGTILFSVPFFTYAAKVYVLPQEHTVEVGEAFIGEVRLNTDGEHINAFEIGVTYTSETLEIIDIIEGDSFVDLWIAPATYSNEEGLLVLQGGVIGGFSGEGVVIGILFKGRSTGIGEVSFLPSSQVLLHDGEGTPTSSTFFPARYSIGPKDLDSIVISSETHPVEGTWYSAPSIEVSWGAKEKALYSYTLSPDFIQNPDEVANTNTPHARFTNALDGIYYFSLRESVDGGRMWSEPTHFTILKDSTAPEPFEILLGNDEKIFDNQNFIAFSTSDTTSGIDLYEVREVHPLWWLGFKKSAWKVINSPYLLPNQQLRRIIEVRATDKVGNTYTAQFKPVYARIVGIVAFIVTTLLVISFVWIFIKNRKKRKH